MTATETKRESDVYLNIRDDEKSKKCFSAAAYCPFRNFK